MYSSIINLPLDAPATTALNVSELPLASKSNFNVISSPNITLPNPITSVLLFCESIPLPTALFVNPTRSTLPLPIAISAPSFNCNVLPLIDAFTVKSPLTFISPLVPLTAFANTLAPVIFNSLLLLNADCMLPAFATFIMPLFTKLSVPLIAFPTVNVPSLVIFF